MPKKILCVGIVCLDVVQACQQFPLEDSVEKSMDYRWQRGGNASNTCTVLSLLGQPCELLACLSGDAHGCFLQNDLCKYKIDYCHCPIMPAKFGCPISTVILNLSTGTRTILHHQANIRDLMLKDFEALNLEEYSWVHFEGRNLDEMIPMIERVKDYNDSLDDIHVQKNNTKNHMPITISVELERPRTELLNLLQFADVVFVAKDFAKRQGFYDMNETIEKMSEIATPLWFNRMPRTVIICPWAEKGATACTTNGTIVQSPAFPPQKVIDTLGAGDTFNAAILYYLNKSKTEFTYKDEAACIIGTNQIKDKSNNSATIKQDIKPNSSIEMLKYNQKKLINENLQEALTFACRVAGAKVGLRGYDGLDKICIDISNFSLD